METKISIITINLNNRLGLDKTIQSVVIQTYSNIEYIVIDGDSNDGSKDLLKNPKIFKTITEQDSGIYNAMNKGINLASGDYCLFLNSGDYLHNSNTITDAVLYINNKPAADIYYGNLVINQNHITYPSNLTLYFLLQQSIPHPASFIKRTLFNDNNVGKYRENYNIVSDWIFALEAYKNQYKFEYINLLVTIFDITGISSINEQDNSAERNHAINTLFPNFQNDLLELREFNLYRSSRLHLLIKNLRLLLFK